MDNFEGGSPMGATAVAQTPAVQTSTMSIPRSEEVVLSHESEVAIGNTSHTPNQIDTLEDRNIADSLLTDAKEIGIAEVFKKLGMGGYRHEIQESPDSSLISFEDFKSQSDSTLESQAHEGYNQTESLMPSDMTDEIRKQEIVSYVSEQVSADPLMKQKIGEVASEMIARGEQIDPEILQEEALSRYVAESESGEPLTLEEKVVSIEEQFAELLQNNEELSNELKEFKALVRQQSETMNTMALALLEMAKKLHKEKDDEEEKITLLELLVRLMGLLLQEMASADPKKQTGQQAGNFKLNVDVSKLPFLAQKKDVQEPPEQKAA